MTGPRRCRRRRGDRGAVTAELAMALPLLVALTVGLVWLLSVGAAQIRVVDAAREAARAAARGDADAVSAGARVAPRGSSVVVTHTGERVVATVTGTVDGPGGLLRFLPRVTLHAEATALDEDGG